MTGLLLASTLWAAELPPPPPAVPALTVSGLVVSSAAVAGSALWLRDQRGSRHGGVYEVALIGLPAFGLGALLVGGARRMHEASLRDAGFGVSRVASGLAIATGVVGMVGLLGPVAPAFALVSLGCSAVAAVGLRGVEVVADGRVVGIKVAF